MRCVLGPPADNVSHAVLGMAGGVPVREAKAAEMNEVVRAVSLVHRRGLRTGVKARFRIFLAEAAECGDVILVGMRKEYVPELKLVLGQQFQDWAGLPAGIKESRLPRNLIPNQITVDGYSLGAGSNLT